MKGNHYPGYVAIFFIASCEKLLQGTQIPLELAPCAGEYSLFVEGECVLCILPQAQLPCFSNLPLPHTQSELELLCPMKRLFLCSPEPSDMEQRRIGRGRRFLNSKIIQIVTIERPPFVKVRESHYSGVVFELISALQQKYNFTQNIFLPYDGNWGSKAEDGSWNGMVGQVLRKEADLAAASVSVTEERAKVVDFSMSFHQEPAAILIPAPTEGNKLEILVKPFSGEVWLAVGCTVCLLGPSLFGLHVIRLHLRYGESKSLDGVRLMVDLFQFIVGSFVQESMISPVNRTTRSVVVVWWFLTLILANVYTGKMVAFLSVPKLYDIVDSLEGLAHQSSILWTYRRHTALEDLFQSNVSATYSKIVSGSKESDLVFSDTAGVEKVLGGRFAFIKEKSFLDVALGRDFGSTKQCRLTLASKTFFNTGFSLAVQKGSAVLDLIDYEILRVLTTGLMEKWKKLHWPQNLWCVNAASYIVSTQPKNRQLTLDDSQGAYFLLLCGLSLASVGFLVERLGAAGRRCVYRRRRNARMVSSRTVASQESSCGSYQPSEQSLGHFETASVTVQLEHRPRKRQLPLSSASRGPSKLWRKLGEWLR